MQPALKKIHIIILILSILYAGIVTWFLSQNSYKYDFENIEEPTSVNFITKLFYHDFEQDGTSEKISIRNMRKNADTFHIKVYKEKDGLIDQWNIRDSILIDKIRFSDVNNDSVDEIIVWSQGRDSLYLSIIDITDTVSTGYTDVFVLRGPTPNPHTFWDIQDLLSLHTNENPNSLFFSINSGHAKSPRGVYQFDLTRKLIVNTFPCNAAITSAALFDINNDGKQELIFGSSATKNFPASAKLSDHHSWLFILSQELDAFFIHQSKTPYGATQFSTKMIKNTPVLYLSNTSKSRETYLFKIDKTINIVDTIYVKGFSPNLHFFTQKGDFYVLFKGWDKSKRIIVDTSFTISDSLFFNAIYETRITTDIDDNKKINFYSTSIKKLIFWDENFERIAAFKHDTDEGLNDISLKRVEGEKLKISINTTKYSYLVELNPSYIYAWLWPLFFLQILLFHSLLFGTHLLINRIRTYVSFFLFTLHDSDNAIILIGHNKKTISVNHKVEETLLLKNRVNRKQYYEDALQERNEICAIIEKCFEKNVPVKEEISFSTSDNNFIGMVTVTPFISYLNFINAYLVEIQDSTKQVVYDRQANWQRNVRRMVHDIKNPLAGVQLKLQTIYLKMLDESPQLAEKLQDEIEVANSEIKRIRNISKDFLKFSDLELIQPEKIYPPDFINECVAAFKAYINQQMSITSSFWDKLPEVFWDKRQIELLLHIIIENAIDAIEGKGEIHIDIKLVQNLNVITEKLIEINISDSGKGIKPELYNKVFEPNFSTKPEGSGMGLVFAKQIVQQHKGSINLLYGSQY